MQKEKHRFCAHIPRIVQKFLFQFLILSMGGKKMNTDRKGRDAHLQN